MQKIIVAACLLISLSSCKKSIERQKENIIIAAMTDGEWVVTSFKLDGADITSDFNPLHFKYYANYTVDAIDHGTIIKTGTWLGNMDAMSISANFAAASNPLLHLNGTWHIDNNSWTFVVASLDENGHKKTMRLEKL